VLRTNSIEGERDVAHEPVDRQAHDPDQQTQQTRGHDRQRGDQCCVEEADRERPRVGIEEIPGDEMKGDIEVRLIGQEPEAEMQVLAR